MYFSRRVFHRWRDATRGGRGGSGGYASANTKIPLEMGRVDQRHFLQNRKLEVPMRSGKRHQMRDEWDWSLLT